MFGALISATDPVATLNIFSSRSVDAPPLLYSIVFGESVLNDAIAIVLYKTFETFRAEPVFHSTSLLTAVVKFFGISIGSTLVGVAVALLLSFATKRVDFRNTAAAHYELTLVALTAYISYFLAEIFSLSGIMSLFFCGVCLAHYNFYNCSVESQDASHLMFKSLAQLCETFVFAFLGITTGISISSSSGVSWDVGLVFLTLVP
jgi:NhaP-type Na+/H+ or K+/H+ antiporter